MTVSLITLRKVLVNIKQKLNDGLKWQCIFYINPSPILIHVIMPTCKTLSYTKLLYVSVVVFFNSKLSIISWLLVITEMFA